MTCRTSLIGVVGCCAVLLGAPLGAAETDQFLTWAEDIDDSTDRFNAYVNLAIEETLDRVNRRGPGGITCESLPPRIYRHAYGGMITSRLRRFVARDPTIDRLPDSDVGYFDYLQQSVFRKPAFPFFLPMARTVRVNDVHVGIDKLSHMFGFGRRYYQRYRRAIRKGRSETEAMQRVVRWGFRMEYIFVGGMTDGVVSSADLEANFQGMLLARDLCEADPPYLTRSGGRWRLARPVDLRDYVNPGFDESYNRSLYTARRWRKVRSILVEQYCPHYTSAPVRARRQLYREMDRPNLSRVIVDEMFASRNGDPRSRQSLDEVCATTTASLESSNR